MEKPIPDSSQPRYGVSYCEKCGKEVEECKSPRFCKNCGGKIVYRDTPRCGNCNFPLFWEDEMVSFCFSCGLPYKEAIRRRIAWWKRSRRYHRHFMRKVRPREELVSAQEISNKDLFWGDIFCTQCGNESVGSLSRFCQKCGGEVVRQRLELIPCHICGRSLVDEKGKHRDNCWYCGRNCEEATRPRSVITLWLLRIKDWYEVRSAAPICRNCEEFLQDNERFCPRCGRSREEAMNAPTQSLIHRLPRLYRYLRGIRQFYYWAE